MALFDAADLNKGGVVSQAQLREGWNEVASGHPFPLNLDGRLLTWLPHSIS